MKILKDKMLSYFFFWIDLKINDYGEVKFLSLSIVLDIKLFQVKESLLLFFLLFLLLSLLCITG